MHLKSAYVVNMASNISEYYMLYATYDITAAAANNDTY